MLFSDIFAYSFEKLKTFFMAQDRAAIEVFHQHLLHLFDFLGNKKCTHRQITDD